VSDFPTLETPRESAIIDAETGVPLAPDAEELPVIQEVIRASR
jgi:hypothetical protein